MARRRKKLSFPPGLTDPSFKDWIYQMWTKLTNPGQISVSQLSTEGITANQVLASDTANSAVVGKTLTGTSPVDVTHSNTAITLSHANSGVTAAQYGNATTVPQLNISVTGHVTVAAGVAVNIPASQVYDFNTAVNAGLSNLGAISGTFGNAVTIPQITVTNNGRVTGVSNVPVNIPVSQLVDGSANQVVRMTNDGSAAAWVDLVAGTNVTLTQNAGNITISASSSGSGGNPSWRISANTTVAANESCTVNGPLQVDDGVFLTVADTGRVLVI